MKPFLFSILIALPIFSYAQVADTAAVRKEVDSLLQLSQKLSTERKFDEALQAIENAERQALNAFVKNHPSYAASLNAHGRTLMVLRRYDEVEPLYLEAKSILEKTVGKEHIDYGRNLISLANLYNQMRRYEAAEPIYLEAKTVMEKTVGKGHIIYAGISYNLATLYKEMGRHEEAEKLYMEAKNSLEKAVGKEHPQYANTLHNLANLYFEMGHYEMAEPLYLEAKSIRAKVFGKAHLDYAQSLGSLGILYRNMGRYETAELFYLEAKTIKEKILGKEHPDYASTIDNLASLYVYMGRYEMAEALYSESIMIRKKTVGKEHIDYAYSLNNLANLYMAMGQYESSEPFFLEAKTILEKTVGKVHLDYAQSIENLGDLYWRMERYKVAEPFFLEAKAILEKTLGQTHPKYATNLQKLANLYSDMGRYDAAEQLYLEAKTIQEKSLGKEHPNYAFSLINLANLYMGQGHYEIAEPLLLAAKSIFEKTLGKDHPDYVPSLEYLSGFYWKTNRFSEAEQLYLEASAIQNKLLLKATRYLSEQELATYSKLFIDDLDLIYSFAQIQPQADAPLSAACFDQSLFYKGFLLTASNRIRHLASSDSTSEQQFELLTSYNRRLAAEYTKPIAERQGVEELETKANTIEKELVRTVAGFGEALRQVNWKEIQQHLKPKEAAVEFIHYQFYKPDATDSTMYAALVLRSVDQQPHFVPLFEEKQLTALLPSVKEKQNNEFISELYRKAASTKDSTGLYELIWKPLDSLLINTTTIYCAPSGLLHRINLSAIASDRNKTMADRFQLVQLGSTRSLVVPDLISASKANNALLFGGIQYQLDTTVIKSDTSSNLIAATSSPALSFNAADRSVPMRGETWRFLPNTEKEVLQIQALLKQSKFSTQLYSRKKATEAIFKSIGKKAASPRILHFATHGFFFPDPKDTINKQQIELNREPVFKISDHPLIRSGLLLAGADYAWQNGKSFKSASEDGILTAYEISQMNLSNTELVVLSACETGLGDIQGNEGVYGLQRAFKIAGAKYLIMSLWKVSDQHTQELMTEFYRQWLQEGRTIRQAFYGAQQKMREKYRFPHLWAGFVLIE